MERETLGAEDIPAYFPRKADMILVQSNRYENESLRLKLKR